MAVQQDSISPLVPMVMGLSVPSDMLRWASDRPSASAIHESGATAGQYKTGPCETATTMRRAWARPLALLPASTATSSLLPVPLTTHTVYCARPPHPPTHPPTSPCGPCRHGRAAPAREGAAAASDAASGRVGGRGDKGRQQELHVVGHQRKLLHGGDQVDGLDTCGGEEERGRGRARVVPVGSGGEG